MARIVACAVVLGALATGTVGLAASGSETLMNRVVFEDVTGEEPGGPDITTIAVSGDGRWLSFRVYVPTNPAVTPDLRMRIWLDVDDSRETGRPAGASARRSASLRGDAISRSVSGQVR